MRNLGGAIGIAACGTLLNDRVNLHFLRLAEHLNSANAAMTSVLQRASAVDTAARGGDALQGQAVALRQLWALTMREALTQTFSDIFLEITVCMLVAMIVVPLMRKAAAPASPSKDAH